MAFDWDDLRVFLGAARAGSLSGASQRLGMDPATVGRRVARLETALKSTLVVRSPSGMQLTAAGSQLFDYALSAEAAMEAAGRVTRPDVVAGTVRISAAEGFGSVVLAPALPKLNALRPGLRLELAAHAGFLSATRREVDMAITLSAPDAQSVVVEPLTHYQLALFASADYLERHGTPTSAADLKRFQIVGYVDDLLYAQELRYLEEIAPGLTARLASSSIRAQQAIIASGGGIGVLPFFLSDGLVRVLPDEVLVERRFWLSIHREVHDTAQVRAVSTWLHDLVKARQSLLSPC